MARDKKYGVIVLAAGYSSRMKAFKPLLALGKSTVVSTVLESVFEVETKEDKQNKAGSLKEAIVVTGYNHKELEKHIKQHFEEGFKDNNSIDHRIKLKCIYNENYDDGMFTSIQAGLKELTNSSREHFDGCFVIPVDCPLCGGEILTKMIANIDDDNFAVPTFMGKKGHPLFVPSKYFHEIICHNGEGGLKGVTDKYFDNMIRIPVDFEGVVLDMDNQKQYKEVLAYYENHVSNEKNRGKGTLRESLQKLAKGKRIILIRHGQIKQHKEKIFLGQTDAPLSEDGRRQAKEAGERLADILGDERAKNKDGLKNSDCTKGQQVIFSSPLKRAKETAEIIANVCNEKCRGGVENAKAYQQRARVRVIDEPGFMEMSLGSWDGKFINEIKEKYPKEYEARGKNIFVFKTGNKSENFYDLQYRTVKALKRILEDNETFKSQDVIIVAHRGVIRALDNNLQGKSVDESWEPIDNGEIKIISL